MNIVDSVNRIPIRLTDERWRHIVENHDDIAGYFFDVLDTISKPTWIVKGDKDALWAIKLISSKKAILVIYKENTEENDGFIITAFITTKIQKLLRRKILWQQR
ncbi:MAG: hypothetical protein ACE14V_06165 [bacterium]